MSTIKVMNINVSGLNQANKYKFNFTNKSGNWPVKVSPSSGIFYPPNIKTYVYFCATTGECPPTDPDVIFNSPKTSINDAGLYFNDKSLYSILDLSISDYDTNQIIYNAPHIVECDNCAPNIGISTDSITLTTGNAQSVPLNLNSRISGLIPNQSYSYIFNSNGGNLPIKIIPRSGIIISTTSSTTLNNLLTVCSSSGECLSQNPNVLNYTTLSECDFKDNLYSNIDLVITPINNLLQNIAHNSFSVLCNNCLQKLTVTQPSNASLGITGVTNYALNTTINNLAPGDTYSYTINKVNSNWPVIVSKQSGVFKASSTNKTIVTDIAFCYPTGSCFSNTTDVFLDYSDNSFYKYSNDKFIILNMTISRSGCNRDTIISNDFRLNCNDCLPVIDYIVAFSGAPTLTLPSGCCSGIKPLSVNIFNAIPFDSHSYRFISSNPNITFSPASGTIAFPRSGNAKLTTLANVNLASQEQSIVELTLTNTANNLQATNSLTIMCETPTGCIY